MKHFYLIERESKRCCELSGDAVTIGTGKDCSLQLDDGPEQVCELVLQGEEWILKDTSGGAAPVRVNDQATLQGALVVGDRLELAGQIWILKTGNPISGIPENDVLADEEAVPPAVVAAVVAAVEPRVDPAISAAQASAVATARRAPRGAVQVKRMKPWVPYALAAVAVAIAVAFTIFVGSGIRVDPVEKLKNNFQAELAELPRFALAGDEEAVTRSLEKARGYLTELRGHGEESYAGKWLARLENRGEQIAEMDRAYRDWWGSPPHLRNLLDEYLRGEDPGLRKLAREYLDQARGKSPGERVAWVPPGGFDPLEARAEAPEAEPRSDRPASERSAPRPVPRDPLADIPAENRTEWSEFLARIEGEADAGRYAMALELVQIAQSEGEAQSSAAALSKHRTELASQVRLRALAAMQQLRDEALELRAQGRFQSALQLLEERVADFPADGEFAQLDTLVRDWKARWKERERGKLAAHPHEPAEEHPAVAETPAAAGGSLAKQLTEACELERTLHYEEAEAILQEVARSAGDASPERAQARGYLEDLALQRSFLASLGKAIEVDTGRYQRLRMKVANKPVVIVGATAVGPRLRFEDGEERAVAWSGLEPKNILRLHRRRNRKLDREQTLAAAVFLQRCGLNAAGDPLLAEVLGRDRKQRPRIDGILARTRREPLPPGGYEWYEKRWVTLKERNTLERAAEIRALVARLDSEKDAERQQAVERLSLLGGEAEDALILALREREEQLLQRLRSSRLAKQIVELAAIREDLDQKRAHALELIFDTEKYFYPFRPPACPAEKAKLYAEVQKEVNNRTSEVKRVWNDPREVTLATQARRDLRGLREVRRFLSEFGEEPGGESMDIPWVHALDPDHKGALSVRDYGCDREDADQIRYSRLVRAFNSVAAPAGGAKAPEVAQLAITNDYRVMMGRRALAWNARIQEAARGHCDEMSKLGYFSHHSPTPGRRTPFDRLKLVGYKRGHSENIATNPSPDGAHHRWLQSSGHHRNILSKRHIEMATGNSGRYWTQNFGGMREFREHELWRSLSARAE